MSSASRVATRWASQIDPPPRMLRDITAWVRATQATEALRAAADYRRNIQDSTADESYEQDEIDRDLVDLALTARLALAAGGKVPTGPKPSSHEAAFPLDLGGWRHERLVKERLDALDASGTPLRGRDSTHWYFLKDGVTVTLHTARRGGLLGDYSAGFINLYFSAPPITDPAWFKRDLALVEQTVAHELRHFAQKLLAAVSPDKSNAGLPAGHKVEEDQRRYWHDKDNMAHATRPVEFYTRLADDIAEFLEFKGHLGAASDHETLRRAVRVFTDQDPSRGFGNRRVEPSEFFRLLHKHDPQRWRKAVSEFVAAVT